MEPLPKEENCFNGSEQLVSVVIPAFNGEKTIRDSIASVLSQAYKPIELIVVDDSSEDSTFEKVKECRNQVALASYRVIRHERNLGLSATLNHGIRESRGKYVIILHQDCTFADDSWIKKAMKCFITDRVAVVTGYYGIPPRKLRFMPRAFGIFRRQYHAVDTKQKTEEVTFSEGKCDVYRKDALEMIGGFPERFRIAGEDLYVSYRLRQKGFRIVKSYGLPVVQHFDSADNLSKNLRKEFTFGKAMGGIFPTFRTFLFRNMSNSKYSRTRSLQRAAQPLFVMGFIFMLLFGILFVSSLLLLLTGMLLIVRYVVYVTVIGKEMVCMADLFRMSRISYVQEALVIAALGVIVDFVYTFGFCYGLILYVTGSKI